MGTLSGIFAVDMRILCLDIGTKRIGVAASDPMGIIAQPLKVLARKGDKADFAEIGNLCRELGVELILIGIPFDEEGGLGPHAKRVKGFAERLGWDLRSTGIKAPIEMWDERYSTALAEERLIEADVSRAKRKKWIDKMAAVVILEEYLAAH